MISLIVSFKLGHSLAIPLLFKMKMNCLNRLSSHPPPRRQTAAQWFLEGARFCRDSVVVPGPSSPPPRRGMKWVMKLFGSSVTTQQSFSSLPTSFGSRHRRLSGRCTWHCPPALSRAHLSVSKLPAGRFRVRDCSPAKFSGSAAQSLNFAASSDSGSARPLVPAVECS